MRPDQQYPVHPNSTLASSFHATKRQVVSTRRNGGTVVFSERPVALEVPPCADVHGPAHNGYAVNPNHADKHRDCRSCFYPENEGAAAAQGITSRSLPIVDQGELKQGRPVQTLNPTQQYPSAHGGRATGRKQMLSNSRSAPAFSFQPRPEPVQVLAQPNDLGPAQFRHGSTLLGGVSLPPNEAHLRATGAGTSSRAYTAPQRLATLFAHRSTSELNGDSLGEWHAKHADMRISRRSAERWARESLQPHVLQRCDGAPRRSRARLSGSERRGRPISPRFRYDDAEADAAADTAAGLGKGRGRGRARAARPTRPPLGVTGAAISAEARAAQLNAMTIREWTQTRGGPPTKQLTKCFNRRQPGQTRGCVQPTFQSQSRNPRSRSGAQWVCEQLLAARAAQKAREAEEAGTEDPQNKRGAAARRRGGARARARARTREAR